MKLATCLSLACAALTVHAEELKPQQIGEKRKQILASYKAKELKKDPKFEKPELFQGKKVKVGSFHISEGYDMKYATFFRGEKPEGGWPLVIAMHGGGGTGKKLAHPHAWEVNTREFRTQIILSAKVYPSDCIYFVPRMVHDNQGRWWKDFNVTAYEALLREAILRWDINPNRVYILGISEGGYGTEVLASWMPDKLAAACGMACGTGTSVPVDNLRNLPFRTEVGEHDKAFGRVTNAIARHKKLDQLKEKDPQGFINHINVQKGKGHGIDYKPGPAWLPQFSRNPHPDRVVYHCTRNDKKMRFGAYWLQCQNDLGDRYIYLDASHKDNQITISAKASKEKGIYQAPDWQQALKPAKEKVPATGLKLRVWLHESMVDFSKPVKLKLNGRESTHKVQPNTEALTSSVEKFGDPNFAYPAFIDVEVK